MPKEIKCKLYMNGDEKDEGTTIEVEPKKFDDIDDFLDFLSHEAKALFGHREKFTKLYTTKGDKVRDIRDLKHKEEYVVGDSRFVKIDYGESKNRRGRGRSRKHSSRSGSRSKSGSRSNSRSGSRKRGKNKRAKSERGRKHRRSRSGSESDDSRDRRHRGKSKSRRHRSR